MQLYEAQDEAVLRSLAAWLRRLALDYEATAAGKFERLARTVERHNWRMAEKRARAVPSKAPERRRA